MAGRFTQSKYDNCATKQFYNQLSEPLSHRMYLGSYVNFQRYCGPDDSSISKRVDVESAILGLDRRASKCDSQKYPFCSRSGCILPNDPSVMKHNDPEACYFSYIGDNSKSVVKSNGKSWMNK